MASNKLTISVELTEVSSDYESEMAIGAIAVKFREKEKGKENRTKSERIEHLGTKRIFSR